MELSGSNIKKFQEKETLKKDINLVIFRGMEPCTFQPKLDK